MVANRSKKSKYSTKISQIFIPKPVFIGVLTNLLFFGIVIYPPQHEGDSLEPGRSLGGGRQPALLGHGWLGLHAHRWGPPRRGAGRSN